MLLNRERALKFMQKRGLVPRPVTVDGLVQEVGRPPAG